VTVVVFVTPFNLAVIVTTVLEDTANVVIVKFAVVEFAGTVTDPGTVAAEVFDEDNVTVAPPGPA
jgi:hypothetical protein